MFPAWVAAVPLAELETWDESNAWWHLQDNVPANQGWKQNIVSQKNDEEQLLIMAWIQDWQTTLHGMYNM